LQAVKAGGGQRNPVPPGKRPGGAYAAAPVLKFEKFEHFPKPGWFRKMLLQNPGLRGKVITLTFRKVEMTKRGRKKVNINEVARAAGVSAMTVSRIFNHTDKVAPGTRNRVQRAIDELRYQPNPIAQGLVTSQTRIIGLLIFDDMDSVFFQQMLSGIQYTAAMKNYNLLIFSRSGEKGILENRYLGMVDGILCMGTRMDNKTMEHLEKEGIPYVVIGRRNWQRVNPLFCAADYTGGFQNVVRYLLHLGHRNLVMIGGIRNYEPDTDKYAGFALALKEAGIQYKPETAVCQNEVRRLRGMLEKYKPTAVVVEGSDMIMALLLCAKEMNLSIPEHLSVISTSDVDAHTLYSLAGIRELTLAEVPRRGLGISGAGLLFRLIEGEQDIPRAQWLELKFTEGESCAPPVKKDGIEDNIVSPILLTL
jgi:LacI family transcriptional regulator